MSYSHTKTNTFTITHARYLSSKAAADMYLCAQYYGNPKEQEITDYAEELAILLRDGYVSQYEFGYRRNNQRLLCWRYIIDEYGSTTVDDRPGILPSNIDISDATFYSFLWYSNKWYSLSLEEREKIKNNLPVKRVSGEPPEDGLGSWTTDKSYSSNGVELNRKTFKVV